MENLPRDIINKIFYFTSHPVAEVFKVELDIAYLRFMEDVEIDEYCDCCAHVWSDCHCICSNCHDDYRSCRYGCYDTHLMLSS